MDVITNPSWFSTLQSSYLSLKSVWQHVIAFEIPYPMHTEPLRMFRHGELPYIIRKILMKLLFVQVSL